MGQPGQLGSQFMGDDAIIRRLQDVERVVRELAAGNMFAPMGISPQPEGLVVSGNMAITGTLSLPAGIIDNEALANPVTGDVVNASVIGFGLSTGLLQQKLSATVTVPSGFTKALVVAYADMTANNSTASGDYCFLRVKIAGTGSAYTSGTFTPAGQYVYSGSSFSRSLTGLSGSFSVTVEAGSDVASWAAHPDFNVINLNAVVTFLR